MSRITQDICGVVDRGKRGQPAAEIPDRAKVEGWVLYDADCGFCTRMAQRFQCLLASRHFDVLPLQTAWVGTKLGLADSDLLSEMRLLLPDGTNFGGVDAVIEISRRYWWAWPLRHMAGIRVVRELLRLAYRWIARRRNCATGVCGSRDVADGTRRVHVLDLLPLMILPILALVFRNHFVSWVFMWTMAGALYAGCKWLTFRQATREGATSNLPRALGYLLAWPGMEAVKFLDKMNIPLKPRATEWEFAFAKTIVGMLLLWGTARMALPAHPIITGWIGMMGVIFVLHFGLFHVLSLCWRQAGVTATPLMQNPLLACSLAEFWGRRWNTAFNELAFRFTFRPLCRWVAPAGATLLVFGISGMVHELVISLPARGGFGLPTAYFLVQGAGLAMQRSPLGRRIGLGRGVCGWFFTLLIAAGPAFWLFHPWFIRNVILPMLSAIGAT